ncbi:exosome complex component RRP4 [Enteropsectra breve]|nr:exosome complex component RRP4 [Enteropsectra breve]
MEERTLFPGETVCKSEGFIRGHGTNNSGEDIISSLMGHRKQINKLVTIEPLQDYMYTPEIGDIVIGRVVQIYNKKWRIQANSKFDTSLCLSAINLPGIMQRRKLESDEMNMRSFFDVDDLVVCEVQKISKSGNASLHSRNEKYGKLENGILACIPLPLNVPVKSRFLQNEHCQIIAGSNGYVWISPLSQTFESFQCTNRLACLINEHVRRSIAVNIEEILQQINM